MEPKFGKNQYGIDMDYVHEKAKKRADYEIEMMYPEKKRNSDEANSMWLRFYWADVKAMSEPFK